MLAIFMLVTSLTLLGILGVLVDINRDLRKGREKLDQVLSSTLLMKVRDGHCGYGRLDVAAFSIWSYEGGTWALLNPCGQPGCTCGPAPEAPGEYEGQVVRKECLPK